MTTKKYQPALLLGSSPRPQWNPDYDGPYAGEFYSEEDFNSILAERDALKVKLDSATKTLLAGGYTLAEGAQAWKPPLRAPGVLLLGLIDDLRAERDALKAERDVLGDELEALRNQEPVGEWKIFNKGGSGEFGSLISDQGFKDGQKFYTSPVPAGPVTQEDL